MYHLMLFLDVPMTRSVQAGSQAGSSDPGDEPLPQDDELFVDGAGIELPSGLAGSARDPSDQAWWTVGEYYPEGSRVTHQSARLTLTGGRVFGPEHREEVWDLSDSLADLYETSKAAIQGRRMHKNHGKAKVTFTSLG